MFSTDADAWKPYTPNSQMPWDRRRVIHLHRRAALAASWGEVERDLHDGPTAAIDRLIAGKARAERSPEDFETISRLLADAATAGGSIQRLKAWWLYRMLFSPDPLGERLTLLWHNHFATAYRKVEDVVLMGRQNEILRECARAPFGELLARVVKDPAMLIWLDAGGNRKEHPNENLARELMELFTLGAGNYSESDVKQAARALTGWSVRDREFCKVPAYHDDGAKSFLDHSGRWDGDDLLRILLGKPATALRLAGRVCELLMGEGTVDEPAVNQLAAGLRDHDLNIGWGVETVLRSAAFFADQNIGTRVLAPVEFIVGAVRALDQLDPPPSTIVLAEWCAVLGQDLFDPPNVFGWPGGRAWLNSRTIIARANFGLHVAEGRLQSASSPPDWLQLAERHGRSGDIEQMVTFFSELLSANCDVDEIRRVCRNAPRGDAALKPDSTRGLVAAMLGSPRAQLG